MWEVFVIVGTDTLHKESVLYCIYWQPVCLFSLQWPFKFVYIIIIFRIIATSILLIEWTTVFYFLDRCTYLLGFVQDYVTIGLELISHCIPHLTVHNVGHVFSTSSLHIMHVERCVCWFCLRLFLTVSFKSVVVYFFRYYLCILYATLCDLKYDVYFL